MSLNPIVRGEVVRVDEAGRSRVARRGFGHAWFLLAVIVLHLAIAVFMNLWDFSLWLIAADLLLIRPEDVSSWRWLAGQKNARRA